VPEAEIPLTGGCFTLGLVRVGDTVRRPHRESSEFVGQLLLQLEARGVTWAPRYLGKDEHGRHSLRYVPGITFPKWRRFADDQVRAAARLLRDIHEATRGSELAGRHSVVCHHDPGPNNVVFQDERPFAFIDFDFAAPGEPLEDLGYMAWSWCVASKPERQPARVQAEQVRVLADAYGLDAATRPALIDAMLERQRRNAAFWAKQLESAEIIASTPEKMRERIAWSHREYAFVVENRAHFAHALG
jgi:Ser/Thr protein kinase RdoA (MazF antagonist)